MFWNAKHISQGKRSIPFVFAIVNIETVLFGGKPVIYQESDMHGLNLQYMIRKNKMQRSLFMEI